jgi:hypothetical protein
MTQTKLSSGRVLSILDGVECSPIAPATSAAARPMLSTSMRFKVLVGFWVLACIGVGLVTAARVDRLERETAHYKNAMLFYRAAGRQAREQLDMCASILENLPK